ncbi:FUSC family protein [Vibrio antiquarius]|uniref:FUSC family protein n=1 Tax=Vibrio antiquarius (strain Ex25) TaxID=150340 RepID=UPI0026592071|nr:FUSC family protein [Vibrio antiquarius]MCR9549408.1 FUSC family protein [Vibrio antiquarius]
MNNPASKRRVAECSSYWQRILVATSFDKGLFRYAVRTTVAAAVALFAAWGMGLEHPQWAAMSVWAVSHSTQTRGTLKEKSLYRIIGTLIGTVVGMLLVYGAKGESLLLVIGLTVWLTFCTGSANIIQGLFSYLVLLSGYTASLVVLLESTQTSGVLNLGIDRFLTVGTGVIVAALIGYLDSKWLDQDVLSIRVKQLTHDVIMVFYELIKQKNCHDRILKLLNEAAEIEAMFDTYGAGSVQSKRSVHTLRAVVYSNVALLTRLYSGVHPSILSNRGYVDSCMQSFTQKQLTIVEEAAVIDKLLTTLKCDVLKNAFEALRNALRQRHTYYQNSMELPLSLIMSSFLQKDWHNSIHAMVRTFVAVSVVGSIWHYTQSSWATFLMLGTSIIVTLFSTFDSPSRVTRGMIIWQMIGFVASLVTQSYLSTSHIAQPYNIIIICLVMALVIIPLSFSRWHSGSMDYSMMFLMLSNLEPSDGFLLAKSLPIGAAAIGGTIAATLAFSFIFPFDRIKRCATMRAKLKRDFERCYTNVAPTSKAKLIHARALHRLLKIIRNRAQVGSNEAIVEAVLMIGCIQAAIHYQRTLTLSPSFNLDTPKRVLAELNLTTMDEKIVEVRLAKLLEEYYSFVPNSTGDNCVDISST